MRQFRMKRFAGADRFCCPSGSPWRFAVQLALVCGLLVCGIGSGLADPPSGTFVGLRFSGAFHHLDLTTGKIPPTAATLFAAQALALHPNGTLYGFTNDGIVYTINSSNGESTAVAWVSDLQISGAAIHAGGICYVTVLTSPFARELGTVDLTTGAYSTVAAMSVGVQGLAFSPSGELYGITPDFGSPKFGTISPTGTFTNLGVTSADVYQSIAFSPDGRLFALGDYFCELDPANGALIGVPVDLTADDFRALEFIPETMSHIPDWMMLD